MTMGRSWMALGIWLCAAIPTLALAQDAPVLRTIDRKQVQSQTVSNGSRENTQTDAAPKTPPAALKTTEKKGLLPSSNIVLKPPVTASKKIKQSLAQQVGIALGDKAVRNATVGIHILDLDSGDVVYSKNADRYLKPASNTKLLTTAAALAILGPDYQFESTFLSQGKIRNGVLDGDLQLHIDHDFTWSTRFYNAGNVPLLGLIDQLKAAGVKKITGKVIVSGYVVYGGVATGTLNASLHLHRVGAQLSQILGKNKISHAGLVYRQNEAPRGKPLGTWKSPMLSEAIVPLNRVSHNEYADMLMLAIGAKKSGKNTFEAGAKAVMAWAQSIGLPTKNLRVHDGSGLSHDNRISPAFFTQLTSWVLTRSDFAREWAASLSIAGYDGTYGGRFMTEEGRGRVYAKSGTLRDVISGSGFFVNRYDHHTYAFSVIVNGNQNRKQTRAAIDRMIRPFLGDFLESPPPAPPRLSSFMQEPDGRVVARWEACANAQGYRIYRSHGGDRWESVAETRDTVLIMPDEQADLRVTAVDDKGGESLPSMIFSYRPGKKKMTVLDLAECRSDDAMRPAGHLLVHERPLAQLVPKDWGIQTARNTLPASSDALILHSVACNGRLAWNQNFFDQALSMQIPVIVNLVDAHLDPAKTSGPCAPLDGKVTGCYGDPVVTKDRRIASRKDNHRQRKAAGTGSSRPSSVASWKNAQISLSMDGTAVAVTEKTSRVSIVGIDLQALDSQKTLDAVWRAIMP